MKIFLSWAGDDRYAETFKKQLEKHFTGLEIFLSSDIDAGAEGISEILKNLKAADYGIIFLTPDNVKRPWLNFECGALFAATSQKAIEKDKHIIDKKKDKNKLKGGKVIPLLIDDLDASELQSPMQSLQAISMNNDKKVKAELEHLFTVIKNNGISETKSTQDFFGNIKNSFKRKK